MMDIPLGLAVDYLPSRSFYVLLNGRYVQDWSLLPMDSVVTVKLRLCGGKGGFGSLLRSFGSQFYKSTNTDACRDLSGRRIRDVNEEQKLKKWIEKAAEREKEREDRKRQKLERLAAKPKHNFDDPEYFSTKQEAMERQDDALQQGLLAAKRLGQKREAGGPSTSSDQPPAKRKNKGKAVLWGMEDIDVSSSDDNSDDEAKPNSSEMKKDEKKTKKDEKQMKEDEEKNEDLADISEETEPSVCPKDDLIVKGCVE